MMPRPVEVLDQAVAQVEGSRHALLLVQLAEGLHDLSQPLTALQCRLEIARMQDETPDSSSAWHAQCLRECGRINLVVAAMRELLQQRGQWVQEERVG